METNWQHLTMTPIFATDPSNPWSWSVIFDSTATKQIGGTRDVTFAKDCEGVPDTYRLRATGAAKQLFEQYNQAHLSLMKSLLCTSDGSVWLRRWLDNPMVSITRSIVA